jgi:predicted transcriptional regulator
VGEATPDQGTDGSEEAVHVTFGTLRALASLERFRILEALVERRKTAAEIAQELNLARGTVHTHAQTPALSRCTLIERQA